MVVANKKDKYNIENYSYSIMCNLDGCNEPVKRCPKCGNNGHISYHIDGESGTEHEIDVRTAYMHGHFALRKNTKTPVLDIGRNLWCYTKRTSVNKLEHCKLRWTLKDKKSLPGWLLKRFEE